ncbi:MAG: DinB superfamily [Actinomycetia bacterium]|nr:DinB superfamily [Actinomycetes bacterium]
MLDAPGAPTDSAEQRRHWLDRLDRAEARLLAHARAGMPAGLTDADAATGERWDAGQVWAHLAEFGDYWLHELRLVLAGTGTEPTPFGRVKSDPVRIAAIEAGRHRRDAEHVTAVQAAIGRLRDLLAGMDDAAWARVGRHQTLGDLDVPAQLQHFHVGHYEEHADQLDGLRAP